MQEGTLKRFNPTKGYGFITPSSGDMEVFVHISAVGRQWPICRVKTVPDHQR
jgi:CspA family cold shock protein